MLGYIFYIKERKYKWSILYFVKIELKYCPTKYKWLDTEDAKYILTYYTQANSKRIILSKNKGQLSQNTIPMYMDILTMTTTNYVAKKCYQRLAQVWRET